MNKLGISIILIFFAFSGYAQFYISGSGGYSLEAGKKTLGSEITASGQSDLEASYGEGIHAQLRGGYLFNEKWALELGLGYLHGADQDVTRISGVPTLPEAEIFARGRAFGASLSGIYNVTENIYVRAGLLTKIGGKTEAISQVAVNNLPVVLFNSSADPTLVADLNVNFTTDFKGKLPIGAIAAAGYKFPIGDNLNLFAEIEYMGINVTRDTSELAEFSATFAGQDVTRDQVVAGIGALIASPATPESTRQTIARFLPLLADEAKWGEGDLPSTEAPYSSFGLNFGITFTFGSAKSAQAN